MKQYQIFDGTSELILYPLYVDLYYVKEELKKQLLLYPNAIVREREVEEWKNV
jgi:hypothetical protein